MKPYLSYKESGIEWIGEIPNYWVHSKLGYVLESNDGGVWGEDTERDDEGVFVFRSTEITIDGKWDLSNPIRRNLVYREIEKAKLKEGDLVITKSSGSQNHIGKTSLVNKEIEKMNVCFSNFVQRIHPKQKVESKFLHYILNSYLVREQYRYQSETTTGLSNLNSDSINNLIISVPPLSEQQQIVSYLDHKTKKIDELIEKTEQKIELLKEKRTFLINHCITKGLDHDAEMKDSGIEWIGEIPSHWDFIPLKLIAYMKGRIGWQGLKQSEFTDEGPYLITGMNFKDGKMDWDNCYHITEERYQEAPEIHVKKGDVLITKDGTIGKLLNMDNPPEKVSLNSHLLLIRPLDGKFLSKFLYYCLHSSYFLGHIDTHKTGTTFFGITQEAMGIFKMLIPTIQEQDRIVQFIEGRLGEIDTIIVGQNKSIELLKEYHQSLISEVVTGKIDLRDEVVI